MTKERFSRQEREWLQATGWQAGDPSPWVAGAPVLPDEGAERLQQYVRTRLDGSPGVRVNAHRHWRRRHTLIVATVFLAAIAVATVAASPGAQAGLARMFRVVAGIGITEAPEGALMLADPVTVAGPAGNVTVIGFIGTEAYSEVRFELTDMPLKQSGPDAEAVYIGTVALRLDDGTRLLSTGSTATVRYGRTDGYARGRALFPGLSTEPGPVVLELSGGLFGREHTYEVELPVIDAAGAAATTLAGGQSADKYGVTLVAPHVVFTDDLIAVAVRAQFPRPGRLLSMRHVTLEDDRQQLYRRLSDDIDVQDLNPRRPLSAVFAGPVRNGAKSLRLTVIEMEFEEDGAATWHVPLSSLSVGQTLASGEHLQVGAWTVTVHSVTRNAENEIVIEYGVSEPPPGMELEMIRVFPTRGAGPVSYGRVGADRGEHTAQATVTVKPTDDEVELEFSRPVVRVVGPWRVDLPVR